MQSIVQVHCSISSEDVIRESIRTPLYADGRDVLRSLLCSALGTMAKPIAEVKYREDQSLVLVQEYNTEATDSGELRHTQIALPSD